MGMEAIGIGRSESGDCSCGVGSSATTESQRNTPRLSATQWEGMRAADEDGLFQGFKLEWCDSEPSLSGGEEDAHAGWCEEAEVGEPNKGGEEEEDKV
eukprot:CAMPEP_0169464156 /NCGR_PEP_ID=MMETSP1042-20121227/20510_1 /TAXON_ID=464988 /ORGANISM="Hemiselmis andersenii, Strain CCMP1180" /LENGTH=97 /DNA_ID=CAMNT_0009576975 /DNA_START=51 /DNA_END=341 /DNA_ORIENTATION=-